MKNLNHINFIKNALIMALIITVGLIPKIIFAQNQPIESKIFAWVDLPITKNPKAEQRQILEGTTPSFKTFKVHATTLHPHSFLKPIHRQENEELIIIKEGELTVTIEGKTKKLSAGGIALMLAGDERGFENTSDTNVTYYVFQYESYLPVDKERGKKAGASLMLNWKEMEFKQHDKGGRRDFFNLPTSMATRFEMHVTTLNEGLMSHPPHTHKAAEILLLINSQNDEISSKAQETIDGTWHDAKVSDVIFLQSNVPHGIRNAGKGTCTYFAFQFE